MAFDDGGLAETARLVAEATPTSTTSSRRVDVADASSVDAFADATFEQWGQVDVLCNNAGVFLGGYLWDRTDDDMNFVLGVNVWGLLHGIRAFVPRMIGQDTEGHVVNTASIAGLFGSPFAGPYNVSKFAAFAVTESLAGDLIASGSKLRASVLCPGIISTNIATTAKERPNETGVDLGGDQSFVTDLLVDMVTNGKEPAEAAEAVVNGIRSEDFLILTHDHHADFIVARAADLAARRLPAIADYT